MRTISVGRQQASPDPGSTQTEDSSAFEQSLVAIQSKLQGLEHKYTTFVTRCISLLKERKALLTSRISGEGGVVDDGFRREISELSKEKDRIEEDIQYMLDLKENSHRRPQSSSGKALIDSLKAVERHCGAAREQLLSAVGRTEQHSLAVAEATEKLRRAVQSVVVELNEARSRQNQEFVQQVKSLQGENQALEKKLKERMMESASESQSTIAQLLRERYELERENRDLSERLRGVTSVPSSPSHKEVTFTDIDVGSPQPTMRRVEASIDPETSRLKRKLIAITKEYELLKLWKQNHVSAPSSLAVMQKLREDVATFAERCEALKQFFSEKLKDLNQVTITFIAAADSGDRTDTYNRCKSALLAALQEDVNTMRQYEKRRHAGTQTTDHDPLSLTGGRLLIRGFEDSDKIAEMRKKVETLITENAKLQQSADAQSRQQRDLLQDCIEMKAEIAMLKALNASAESEKQSLNQQLSTEKAARDKLREDRSKGKLWEFGVRTALEQLAEKVSIQCVNVTGKCASFEEHIGRIKRAEECVKTLKKRLLASKALLSQAKISAKAHVSTLQTLMKSKENEISRIQSQFQHQLAAKDNEISVILSSNEALQKEMRQIIALGQEFQDRGRDLEESLKQSNEICVDLEEKLGREREARRKATEELATAKAKVAALETENDAERSHSLEVENNLLQLNLKAIKAQYESELSQLRETIQSHASTNSTLSEEIHSLQRTLELEKEKSESLERKMASLQSLETELQVLRDSEGRRKAECERYRSRQYWWKSKLVVLQQSLKEVKYQLAESRVALNAFASEEETASAAQLFALQSLVADIQKSKEDLRTTQNTLKECQHYIEIVKKRLADWVQSLLCDGKISLEVPVDSQFESLQRIIDEQMRFYIAESEALKQSKALLTQLLQKVDGENEVLGKRLERVCCELEDIRGCTERMVDRSPIARISLGLDHQLTEWEAEKETLLQTFAKEKFELIAANESECQYLRNQLAKYSAPKPQVIVAEEEMSDIEVQRLSESFEVGIVRKEKSPEPNRAFYTLFRLLSAHADSTKTDIDQLVATVERIITGERPHAVALFAGETEKETQTSFKYRDVASYLSVEDDISAVAQALKPTDVDSSQSFERVMDGPFEIREFPPSFDASRSGEMEKSDISDGRPLALRQLQTEPEEDHALQQHYLALEKDLEDEIRTNHLMQQQIQLLKEEMMQKDRQLLRLSEKPQINGEVLASAFGKLMKMIPHL